MVNSNDFIKRLDKILRYYDVSASSFADQINVQRSSISHLLSGRNKPSLEFVMKVIKTYPEINLYWLLNGKGSFPSSPSNQKTIIAPTPPEQAKKIASTWVNKPIEKKIDKIVIFYTDGSFRSYRE